MFRYFFMSEQQLHTDLGMSRLCLLPQTLNPKPSTLNRICVVSRLSAVKCKSQFVGGCLAACDFRASELGVPWFPNPPGSYYIGY